MTIESSRVSKNEKNKKKLLKKYWNIYARRESHILNALDLP